MVSPPALFAPQYADLEIEEIDMLALGDADAILVTYLSEWMVGHSERVHLGVQSPSRTLTSTLPFNCSLRPAPQFSVRSGSSLLSLALRPAADSTQAGRHPCLGAQEAL